MLFVRCAPLPGNTQTVGSDSTKVSCQRKPMEDLSLISFQPEAENRTAHTFVVNSCMQTLVRDVNWRRRITTAYSRLKSQSSASQIRRDGPTTRATNCNIICRTTSRNHPEQQVGPLPRLHTHVCSCNKLRHVQVAHRYGVHTRV